MVSSRELRSIRLFGFSNVTLTLIWVGFLGASFKVKGGGGGGKLPRLKLVRIMLENSNLAHKYTHICSLRKYIF